eukprot:4124602-Amphidinium_carterae.1
MLLKTQRKQTETGKKLMVPSCRAATVKVAKYNLIFISQNDKSSTLSFEESCYWASRSGMTNQRA